MNRYISNALGLSAVGALLALGWASFEAGRTIQENRADARAAVAGAKEALSPTGSGLPTVFNEARDITIAILKPCKPGKPETCGLIPSVRSVAVSAGESVNQTQPLIRTAAQAVSDTSTHANEAIDAAREATQQARTDLQTLNGSISESRALLGASTLTVQHFDELVQSKDLSEALHHVNGVTASADGILADGKKVTDQATADYLSPKPWWKKIGRYASDTYDYGALFARHTP